METDIIIVNADSLTEVCVYCGSPLGDNGPTQAVEPDTFGTERGVAHEVCRANRVSLWHEAGR